MNKIEIEDRTKVKKVIFKYPELMNNDAEKRIIQDYKSLLELEDEVYKLREELRALEEKRDKHKKVFDSQKDLFTLVFETYTKDIIKNKTNIQFGNLGNDTLGTYNG